MAYTSIPNLNLRRIRQAILLVKLVKPKHLQPTALWSEVNCTRYRYINKQTEKPSAYCVNIVNACSRCSVHFSRPIRVSFCTCRPQKQPGGERGIASRACLGTLPSTIFDAGSHLNLAAIAYLGRRTTVPPIVKELTRFIKETAATADPNHTSRSAKQRQAEEPQQTMPPFISRVSWYTAGPMRKAIS